MNLDVSNSTNVQPAAHDAAAAQTLDADTRARPAQGAPAIGSVSGAVVQVRDLRAGPRSDSKSLAIGTAAGRQAVVQVIAMGASMTATRTALAAGWSPIVAQGAGQCAVLLAKEVLPIKAGHEMRATDKTYLLGIRSDIAVNLFDGIVAAGMLAGATRLTSHLIGADMAAVLAPTTAEALQTVLRDWRVLAQTQGIVRTADWLHDVATAAAHAFSPDAEHKYNAPGQWSSWTALSSKAGVVGFMGGALARGITVAVTMGGAVAVSRATGGGTAYSLQSMKQNAAGIAARSLEALSKQGLKEGLGWLILRRPAPDEEAAPAGGMPPAQQPEAEAAPSGSEPASPSEPPAEMDELQVAAATPLPPSPRASTDEGRAVRQPASDSPPAKPE